MLKIKFTAKLLGAFIILASSYKALAESSENYGRRETSGTEYFSVTGTNPNIGRCGAAPSIEIHASGSGIDRAFGAFTVVASFCFDPTNNRVFDLLATDTFIINGSTTTIAGEAYTQESDPSICWTGNRRPVDFRYVGGTGVLSGIHGRGTFDIQGNDTNCNGQQFPSFVTYCGTYSLR